MFHARLFLFVVLIFSCFSSISCQNFTCVPVNFNTTSPFCSGYVNWLVPSTLDPSGADYLASRMGSDPGACPFFLYKPYICAKYFPLCENIPPNGPTQLKLCNSDCLEAKYANSKQCQYYSDGYFQSECGDINYFTTSPVCRHPPVLSESDDSYAWKIGLGVSCFVAAGVMAFFLIRKYRRDNMTAAELEAHDKRKEEKRLEELKKQRERDAAHLQEGNYGNLMEEPGHEGHAAAAAGGAREGVPGAGAVNGAELARMRIAAARQKELEEQIRIQKEMEDKWAAEAAAKRAAQSRSMGSSEEREGIPDSQAAHASSTELVARSAPVASDGYVGTRVRLPEEDNFV